MIEIIGYISAFLFAFCALPQAIMSFKDGHSNGVSGLFLSMWLGGEILAQVYVGMKHGLDLPLMINYWINCVFILIIAYFKLRPRQTENLITETHVIKGVRLPDTKITIKTRK